MRLAAEHGDARRARGVEHVVERAQGKERGAGPEGPAVGTEAGRSLAPLRLAGRKEAGRLLAQRL